MTISNASSLDTGPRPARRSRRLVVGLGLVLTGFGVLWWSNPLRGLPDIGEPFDTNAFVKVDVADEANAFSLYRQASSLFTPKDPPPDGSRWETATSPQRQWLEDNRQAILTYLEGSRRPAALYHHPASLRWDTLLPVTQSLRGLSRASLFEATKREHEGDLAGAWECYRAILRSSRHTGHRGAVIERLVGIAMMREAVDPIERWAADPRVDAELLRRALVDAKDAAENTPPVSETLRGEYLMAIQSLRDPGLPALLRTMTPQTSRTFRLGPLTFDWASFRNSAGALRLRGEPEKSVRLLQMAYANALAYCDLPADRRPRLVVTEPFAVYEPAPDAPAEVRAILEGGRIEALRGSLFGTLAGGPFGRILLPSASLDGLCPADVERREQERLIEFLENELRRRTEGADGVSAPPET